MISFLYSCAMSILQHLLPIVKFIPHKKLQYFATHQGQVNINQAFQSKPIWIHASSGEIEYAASLIREIRLTNPEIPILVTHTSLSSLNALKKLDVHAIGVLPFDQKNSVKKFLNRVQPRICLLARTDLWPEMISELENRKIPCCLFSATFAKGSKKSGFIASLFLRPAIQKLTQIYYVATEDQNLCEQLYGPIKTGLVLGDSRYDQVVHRLLNSKKIPLPYFEKILLLGSTWAEDETALMASVARLKSSGWKFIWVPHEVHFKPINQLLSQLKNKSLSVGLYSSDFANWNWKDFDVLLVDQVGQLASLYSHSQIAFVGGSFKKQVHSVMEPLAAGCTVLVGPYHHNNREALEFKELDFVIEIDAAVDLTSICQKLMLDHDRRKSLILSQVGLRTGATKKLMGQLKTMGVFDAHPLEQPLESN